MTDDCASLTLLEALERHATEQAFKPAFIYWSENHYILLSYCDLWRASNAFADQLYHIGIQGDEVLIILKHHPLLQVSFLGAMLAGATPSYLPCPTSKQDPALYWSSHLKLFDRVKPKVILTYGELVTSVGAICPEGTLVCDIDDFANHVPSLPARPIRPPATDRVALLQHSSGTTGLKKGVLLSFRQIAAQVGAYAPTIDLNSRSTLISWLPLYHDMGLFTAFIIPISIGATVVSIDPFEWVKRPALLLELIERFQGTHVFMPNFAFNHIVNSTLPGATYDLTSMTAFFSCSEPVKANTFALFLERFASCGLDATKLQACYAMAEACFAVTQSRLGEHYRVVSQIGGEEEKTRSFISNGRPIPGIEVRLFAEDGTLFSEAAIASGARGEIAIRGAFLFSGYDRNPEATAQAFVDGWYRTGDMGFFENGELVICGRTKEIIIVHGRNYYMHDIEEIVSGLPGIFPGRVVAIGVEETGGEELLVMAETNAPPAAHKQMKRKVKQAIFSTLELTPKYVEFLPRGLLKKTTSGKMSRADNLALFRRRIIDTTFF